MLADFMGHCAPNSAFRDVASLDATISFSEDGSPVTLADTIADPSESIDERLTAKAVAECVRDFVRSLPEPLRCIAFRHYVLDHSQARIASDLGVTRSAICHALRRIHNLGRAKLEPIVLA